MFTWSRKVDTQSSYKRNSCTGLDIATQAQAVNMSSKEDAEHQFKASSGQIGTGNSSWAFWLSQQAGQDSVPSRGSNNYNLRRGNVSRV